MADLQAGWYPDPSGDATKQRYWDGAQWTDNYRDVGQAAQPTESVAPATPVAPAPVAPTQPVPPAQPMQPQPQVQQQTYVPASAGAPKKKTGLIVGIIAGAVVVIVAVVLILVFVVFKDNTPDSSANNNNAPSITTPDNNSSDNSSDSTSAQQLSGEVTGQVGTEYATKWFKFTVNSLTTTQSFADHTASGGNMLVVANITITNTSGSTQPFGTFDWFIDDDSLTEYIWPMDPLNSSMMPTSFDLEDGSTVTYDVVIEASADLASPYLIYAEMGADQSVGTMFKIAIK